MVLLYNKVKIMITQFANIRFLMNLRVSFLSKTFIQGGVYKKTDMVHTQDAPVYELSCIYMRVHRASGSANACPYKQILSRYRA